MNRDTIKLNSNIKENVGISFNSYRIQSLGHYQSSIRNFRRCTAMYLDTFPGKKHFCNANLKVQHMCYQQFHVPIVVDIKRYKNILSKKERGFTQILHHTLKCM